MMSVSSVVEPEIVEADEQISYAASERLSMAETRRDSDFLIRQTFALEVKRQL